MDRALKKGYNNGKARMKAEGLKKFAIWNCRLYFVWRLIKI